jgi:hypothetical protein
MGAPVASVSTLPSVLPPECLGLLSPSKIGEHSQSWSRVAIDDADVDADADKVSRDEQIFGWKAQGKSRARL